MGKPAGARYENASEEGASTVRAAREGPTPGPVGALETQLSDSDESEAFRARRVDSLAPPPAIKREAPPPSWAHFLDFFFSAGEGLRMAAARLVRASRHALSVWASILAAPFLGWPAAVI